MSNYEEFDYQQLSTFENIKDKQILVLMFRKFSQDKLKNILLANYYQFINDYAFLEYSKKTIDLNLESIVINNISDNVLFSELKRRKLKQKNTNIDIKDFISLSTEKQIGIFLNGNLSVLETEMIKAYLEKYSFTEKKELIDRFKNVLQNFNYIVLMELQTIIYSIDDESAIELMNLFFKNVLKFENDVELKYLKSMIFNFKKLINQTSELYSILQMKPFALINYLNTGIINEDLDKIFDKQIKIEQYQKINIKKLNKINKILNKLYRNEDAISQESWVVIFSYKLYMIFGYENSLELLSGKFGNIDYHILTQLLDKCDVMNVDFNVVNNSYEPNINQDFIQFLIGEKKDNNTTLKRILRGELDIIKNEFANLYNNFERFQQAIGNKIHLNKLLPLLQKNPFMLLPNEYKLTKDILDNFIKSYNYFDVVGEPQEQINDNSIEQYILAACNFYHDYLEKRIISTIPRVVGSTKDQYSYEVLKLDDPIIMTLGYQTGCCFRLNGMSCEFLKYCSESIYARVIVIKNEFGEICSMIPIIRNGNVIVGNSIETNSKGDSYKVYKALKSAYDDILEISEVNEEKPIIACLVSNLHSNCYSNKAVNKKIYPIRNKSILYTLNQTKEYTYFAIYIICSEDWLLKVDYDGIDGLYIEKDPRAVEEFNAVKKYLESKFANKKIYEFNLDESDLIGNNLNSITPKKLVLQKNVN